MGIFDDFSVHFRLIILSIFPLSQRIDHLKLTFVAAKPPPFHVFTEVALPGVQFHHRWGVEESIRSSNAGVKPHRGAASA